MYSPNPGSCHGEDSHRQSKKSRNSVGSSGPKFDHHAWRGWPQRSGKGVLDSMSQRGDGAIQEAHRCGEACGGAIGERPRMSDGGASKGGIMIEKRYKQRLSGRTWELQKTTVLTVRCHHPLHHL